MKISPEVKIGAIYRPPDKSVVSFTDYLDKHLFGPSFNSDDKYIIAGDMNIKYCPVSIASNQRSLDYSTFFMENDFQFLIDKSTRFDKSNQSIIDHMWSNIKVNYTSCVLCSPLSDHFPTFANFELKPACHSRWIKFRDFSNKTVHMCMSSTKLKFLHLFMKRNLVR